SALFRPELRTSRLILLGKLRELFFRAIAFYPTSHNARRGIGSRQDIDHVRLSGKKLFQGGDRKEPRYWPIQKREPQALRFRLDLALVNPISRMLNDFRTSTHCTQCS